MHDLEKSFKKIGIYSTIAMLKSEQRHHKLKIMEYAHDGSRNATEITDKCNQYIHYILDELSRLQNELLELDK